ncbi:uncharacterized protein N0V89_005634 [Didymosphaeria variabile]|uniref:Uncharacterized protein n=1 Tax=Didymosphaeria variabile TaxID=1932322 RepID=A0A9W9CBX5_9PLEO|nr:uncharacterized protein N0V89_005634 [Didymosphaeria variabile]KAJ4353903.1 hypothetical protein N0V89_005634 [Didymosphaeria variabile]
MFIFKIPGPLPIPPVPSALPALNNMSKPDSKNRGPNQLHVYFHPHPIKSINKTHVNSIMSSLTPGAAPVDTGFYIQTCRNLFHRGTKAPFTANREASTKRKKWHIQSTTSYQELVDVYLKKGYVEATVRSVDGKENVKCTVVMVAPGEKVPKGLWKIRIWKEPVKWVVSKLMTLEGALVRARKEKVEKQKTKDEEKEALKRLEEKEKDLETESLSSEDEKDVKSWL